MQLSIWRSHGLGLATPQYFGAATDCAGASICLGSDTYPQIFTQAILPGTYTLAACDSPRVVIEPPPPAPTNISCATAAPIDISGGYLQRRVLDGNQRYYTFMRTSSSGYGAITVHNTMNIGRLAVSVRTNCSDPATEVANGDLPYALDGFIVVALPPGTPVATYWVVTTAISQGFEYTLTASN
jgi:hypothetical protein